MVRLNIEVLFGLATNGLISSLIKEMQVLQDHLMPMAR